MTSDRGGEELDPLEAVTTADFVELLRQLKQNSGLSYRQLERRAKMAGEVLPYSTLAMALSKNTLPRTDLVATFVRACGQDPADWVAARKRLTRNPAPNPPHPDTEHPDPTPPTPPPANDGVRRGRIMIMMVAVSAVLALVIGWPSVAVDRSGADGALAQDGHGCHGPDLRVDPRTHECWGISGRKAPMTSFQPNSPLLSQVITEISQQNQASTAIHRLQPERPYVTLAYVAALTSREAYPTTLVAERETVEGIAAAQKLYLQRTTPGAPLLNVLIANGAAGMAHGVEVTRMLAHLPAVTGVIGLDQSRQNTINTIRALGAAGIPMVAAALTADQLPGSSPLYFQIAPQNKSSASAAADYATSALHGLSTMKIYYSADPADVYSSNLDADLTASFHAKGLTIDQAQFRPMLAQSITPSTPTAYQAGKSACGYRGLTYHAGRAEDFGDFLHGIYSACGSSPPRIMADDDVTRYVADPRLRHMYPSIPFHYTSFAIAPGTCPQAMTDTFYSTLDTLFPFECDSTGRSLDGHAALGYDATLTVLTAVENLATTPTRSTLATALTGIHIGGAASAPITVGQNHTPTHKMIAILTVAHGQLPTAAATYGEPPTCSWCPPKALPPK
ncbi:hypothetical protein [Actinoallomurus sp. NPDC050550]|uniref:hypothetical protein n=1 Tax=Actinoallomurus sp. NPDC050550 TaxID=3154937 RepID=UPI0033D7B687